ncbi:unnamed protein product [Urochloa decumbens]|uniref:Rx N-terminal domain-containing protein n=1 Tax=Urochloa decumbens TaxID=240449 RepID=A0ABC9B764_9POAL
MMVGTLVDAAIGCLVESILGYFFIGKLEAWIHGVGLADDVEELKAAVRLVQMVVAAAKGRKIENEPLARSVDAMKELLYDADDVMDELDYYRLKLQVERDNSIAGTPDAANNTEVKSTWLSSSIRQLGSSIISSVGTISSIGSSRGKRKREDDHHIAASSHLEILENKSEFSSRIKHIVRKLRQLGIDVSNVMGIDGSNSAGTSNLGRYHDNPTTSYLVEPKHLIDPRDLHSSIANIGKMTALQELYKFKVQAQNDSGFDIRQLKFLSQLVKLGIYQLENVQSKQEASEARLIDKVNLEDVCLSWDTSSTSSGPSTETAIDVLEGLRPHPSLKHLQIIGYNGSSYPSWLATDISITSLQSLHLEKCKKLGVLPQLLKLPLLRKLELKDMPNIVEVTIPCLEELELIELPKLEKCVAISNSKLNCGLQSLIIEECPELNDFALLTSENFCSFEVIQDSGMSQLESYSAEDLSAEAEKKKWLPVLDVLRIHGCPRLKLIRALPPSSNTRLSIEGLSAYPAIEIRFGNLSVKSSNDLKVLDEKILAFQNLKDVTSVEIEHCPNLEFLSFEGFRQLNNVRKMTVSKCGNLVSFVPNAVSETWRATTCPAFPHLKHLKIESSGNRTLLKELKVEDSPDLQSLRLHSCTALERLRICECRQVAVLEGLQYLNSLRSLSIDMNPELSRSWVRKYQEVEQGSGHVCLLPPSLERLNIDNLQEELMPYLLARLPCLSNLQVYSSPNLTSLQLGSLAALKKLSIGDCDSLASIQSCLSELEECEFWGQDLTSLQPGSLTALKHLTLDCCTGLASLERQFLGDLIDLEIEDCSCSIPALLEFLSRQADSFSIFPRMERLSVDDLSALATSLCRHLASLRCLELSSLEGVACFTDEQEKALQLLTSLQELEFDTCMELADLPAKLYSLDSQKVRNHILSTHLKAT